MTDLLRERLRQRFADRLQQRDAMPWSPPAGTSVERDLPYGEQPLQRMDLYRPAAATADAPLALFIHGGGWRRGDKAMPRMVANKAAHWLRRGWCFASANYRMLPEAGVLEQADDVARALDVALCLAPRVLLVGHSAGAHLAALVAATRREPAWLATICIDSAALDVPALMREPHFALHDAAFGSDPAFWRAASPVHRLAGPPAAPMLLVCSSQRADSIAAAMALAAKAGGNVEVLTVDLGHMALNDGLGSDPGYTAAVDAFVESVSN